jgi:ankyrin repeat protein
MAYGSEEQKANYKFNFEDAMFNVNLENIKEYLANGGDINRQDSNEGYSLLHKAVIHGKLDCVKFLIENGANMFAKTYNGKVPARLTTCVYEIYTILKDSINVPDNEGNTRMHLAAKNDNYALIKHLISIGAKFDIKNGNDETAVDLCSNKEFFKSDEEKLRELVNGRIKWALEVLLE